MDSNVHANTEIVKHSTVERDNVKNVDDNNLESINVNPTNSTTTNVTAVKTNEKPTNSTELKPVVPVVKPADKTKKILIIQVKKILKYQVI